MIALKCPQCGRTVDAPDEMAEAGEKCYPCNRVLEFANPAMAQSRVATQSVQAHGMLLGACIGAATVPLLAAFGGSFGLAVAGGIAGALLGALQGFIGGWLEGNALAVLLANDAWVTRWAKVWMVVGFCSGTLMGVLGKFDNNDGKWVIAFFGTVGGLILGGLLGAHFSQRKEQPPV